EILVMRTPPADDREPACRLADLLAEGLDGRGFVVLDVKDGIELGDLQQIVHFLGQLQQLQLSAFAADRGESADQFADAGAVNVGHVAQIEQDLFLAFADQVADGVAQYHAAFSQSDAAAHIHNSHAVHLPIGCFHAHYASSYLAFAALRPVCLISVTSVPGFVFRIFTSSIKARIKKIPRPEPFIRLSGASGSGKDSGSSPLPWSVMVITSESPVVSYATTNLFPGS